MRMRTFTPPTTRASRGGRGRARGGSAALAAAIAFTVAGCAGQRPTVTPQEGPAINVNTDPAAAAVVDRLTGYPDTFTAVYTITPTLAGVKPAKATVTVAGERQHIAIGDIDYYIGPGVAMTCAAKKTTCADGVNDAYVSDLAITHDFWGVAMAQRLANDISRKIGTSTERSETFAGQKATCVDVRLAGQADSGTVSYCALATGPLARYVGADTAVELTTFDLDAADADLSPPISGQPSPTGTPLGSGPPPVMATTPSISSPGTAVSSSVATVPSLATTVPPTSAPQ